MARCTPASVPDPERFVDDARVFKALADPTRLAIVASLAGASDEVCVCDFTEALPINQSSVSHHLAILREAGIVTSERRGTWAYYSLASAARASVEAALQRALPPKKRLTRAS